MEHDEEDDEHLLSDLSMIRVPLGTLTHNLKVAVRFHEEHDDPALRRKAAIGSLVAVIDFLNEIDRLYKKQLSKPLFTLFMALDRVDQGKRSPLLEPLDGKKGRPADTDFEAACKGWAAAAMTLLMDNGLSQKEAASKVAKEMSRHGYRLPGGKEPTARAVRGWRDECIGCHDGTTMPTSYESALKTAHDLGITGCAAALRLAALAGKRERGFLLGSTFLKNPEKPPS